MNATAFARPAALLCALGFALAQPAAAQGVETKHRSFAPPVYAAASQRQHVAPPMRRAAPPVRHAAPAPRAFAPRAPAAHRWQRGERMPLHARRPVHDWRARRLPPPPPGHQWVQAEPGYYAQIALATGMITLLVNV